MRASIFCNSLRMWLSAVQVFVQKKKRAPVYSTHRSHLSNLAASSSDMTSEFAKRHTALSVLGILGLQAPGLGRPPQEDDSSGHHATATVG